MLWANKLARASLAGIVTAATIAWIAAESRAPGNADAPAPIAATDKQRLAPLRTLVGAWRGTGQPKRGSAAGAWLEEFDWSWRFDGAAAELVAESPQGKFYRRLSIRPAPQPGRFTLQATPPDADGPESFVAERNEQGDLVAMAAQPAADRPARITLRLTANGDRLLTLFEKRAGADRFERLAEIGATRKGSQFARGSGEPECVVTGGRGSIVVQHDGQKYFVCCTGCRDAFQDDPAGVIAEYRERKAAEKAAREAARAAQQAPSDDE